MFDIKMSRFGHFTSLNLKESCRNRMDYGALSGFHAQGQRYCERPERLVQRAGQRTLHCGFDKTHCAFECRECKDYRRTANGGVLEEFDFTEGE